LISEEDFIKGIEWMVDEPLDDKGRIVKDLGLYINPNMEQKRLNEQYPDFSMPFDKNDLNGKIFKIRRSYDNSGSRVFSFWEDTKLGEEKYEKNVLVTNAGITFVSINALDKI
ncbi:hypothetical protein, partial [Staphylococcus nepalensis]|uniref:hypothetical protein n=1 Tax=Staphylococcus nepalensis TaxID=214473 RepID=UPI0024BABAA9